MLSPVDRHLVSSFPSYTDTIVPSVSEIDGGYGVHLVYDLSSAGQGLGGGGDNGGSTGGGGDNGGSGDSGDGQSVPDGGSPLVLLGASMAVMGLVRFHSGGYKSA